jgi:hypothetical protein
VVSIVSLRRRQIHAIVVAAARLFPPLLCRKKARQDHDHFLKLKTKTQKLQISGVTTGNAGAREQTNTNKHIHHEKQAYLYHNIGVATVSSVTTTF